MIKKRKYNIQIVNYSKLLTLFRDGDSYIDWEELRQALICLSADPPVETWEVDEMFQEADKNGDGYIDVEGQFHLWFLLFSTLMRTTNTKSHTSPCQVDDQNFSSMWRISWMFNSLKVGKMSHVQCFLKKKF